MREPPAEEPARRPGFLLPFGRRPSLLGSSCARWGVQPSSRSAYRLAFGSPDPIGVVVLRMSKTRPGRAPSLLRGRWCVPDRRLSSGRHLPLSSGQPLRPRSNFPPAGVTFTKRHRGFTHVRPSPPAAHHPGLGACQLPPVFSSPVSAGWNGRPWAFPPSFAPRSYPRRTSRWRRATRTGPSTTPSASAEPPTAPPT